ncbi:TetR/AcrR family transcriptional regulator [Nocardia brevicatena]|uniref:TetR/AcrR family transcriptional regulator n=1 Tax=Nocardia brevicatena TaxID=37327 RepID=UPI0002FA0547|nr:TetR/AcrR family transcriptional regulator [Nocardia brevicatena]
MAHIALDDRRRQIVDAAVEVMATEGLARTTTRRVAERANAPLGALHYSFRNKEELIHLVMDRGAETLVECFRIVDPDQGMELTIRSCIAAMWNWYQQNIGLQMALTEFGMTRIRRGGDPKEVYAIWGPFGQDLLHDNLRRAAEIEPVPPRVPVDDIARFILHRFDGLTLEYAASLDRDACRRQVDLLAEALIKVALRD